MPELLQNLVVAALIGSTAFNAWLFFRSQARRVERIAIESRAIAEAARLGLESVEMRVNNWKLELDGINEQVVDGLSRAETKRNRAETAERAQAKRMDLEQPAAPQTREELLAPYRRTLLREQ